MVEGSFEYGTMDKPKYMNLFNHMCHRREVVKQANRIFFFLFLYGRHVVLFCRNCQAVGHWDNCMRTKSGSGDPFFLTSDPVTVGMGYGKHGG